MSNVVNNTNSKTFDQDVLSNERPVLVDFYADWCGPCRTLAPTVEQLADEYQGRLAVHKVDVDANSKLAAQFGVRSIPTLILFSQGQVKETIVGAASKAQLKGALEQHVP